MDRRKFLTSLTVAPVVPFISIPALAAIPGPEYYFSWSGPGLRIIGHCEGEMLEDPGHKLWAQHRGICCGQWRVLLDGVNQHWFVAADENEGWVRRDVTVGDTQCGDPSFLCIGGDGNWLQETVYGEVEIVPLVTEEAMKYYPFDIVREQMPYLYSRLKIEGVNCPVGFY